MTMTMTDTDIRINDLTPFIGAEMTGVTYEDLQEPVVWDKVTTLLHERSVLRLCTINPLITEADLAGTIERI